MSEFDTEGVLSVVVDQRSLQSAKREIQSEMAEVGSVSVDTSNGTAAPAGGGGRRLKTIGEHTDTLVGLAQERNDLLEELVETTEKGGFDASLRGGRMRGPGSGGFGGAGGAAALLVGLGAGGLIEALNNFDPELDVPPIPPVDVSVPRALKPVRIDVPGALDPVDIPVPDPLDPIKLPEPDWLPITIPRPDWLPSGEPSPSPSPSPGPSPGSWPTDDGSPSGTGGREPVVVDGPGGPPSPFEGEGGGVVDTTPGAEDDGDTGSGVSPGEAAGAVGAGGVAAWVMRTALQGGGSSAAGGGVGLPPVDTIRDIDEQFQAPGPLREIDERYGAGTPTDVERFSGDNNLPSERRNQTDVEVNNEYRVDGLRDLERKMEDAKRDIKKDLEREFSSLF